MKLYVINRIRTNHFNDEQEMKKIKTLWEEASRSLTDYKNSRYGVYYDYESDFKGDYSLGVAIEDKYDQTQIIEIPNSEQYKVFPVDSTDEQGIIKAWSNIWDLEKEGTLQRAYTVDYEKYYPNGEIEIYIAVK